MLRVAHRSSVPESHTRPADYEPRRPAHAAVPFYLDKRLIRHPFRWPLDRVFARCHVHGDGLPSPESGARPMSADESVRSGRFANW
jgi:hypothetical protein